MKRVDGGVEVRLGGMDLVLDPGGAVVDPATDIGFVADLHLGKTTLFRRRGLAVPEGDEERDLARLGALVTTHGLRHLVVLGDLVHAAEGLLPEVVARLSRWRRRYPSLEVTLVRGNHDRGAGPLPRAWRLRAVDGPRSFGGVVGRHEPPREDAERAATAAAGPPVLAGHLHPVVRIGAGRRGGGIRARCFWWRPPTLVLPAFGSFTGGHRVEARAGERVFAVPPSGGVEGPPEVVEVTPVPGGSG